MEQTTQSDFSRLRQDAGMTVKEAAALLAISLSTAYRYDSGETAPRMAELAALRGMGPLRSARERNKRREWFSFIDLFAGIGGLRRAFEGIGGHCVFTSEWDKYSQLTYRANFRCDHELAGDIREVDPKNIPHHDVLLAGFPCQPFSIAGVSKKNALNRPHGFACEAQGTLFFEMARIIADHRPAAFLLENVKNLVSHDRGNTFRVIRQTLEQELGYVVDYRVIDARSFLPQHRERIIIVGFRSDAGFRFNRLHIPDRGLGPTLETILHPEDGTEEAEEGFTEGTLAKVSAKYTLTEHLWTYLQNYAQKHREKGNGFGFGLVGPGDVARTLSARYYKDGSSILVRQAHRPPRRLTPRECARLMGFDGPDEPRWRIPVSDTQAYRQFGDSSAIPVIEAVAGHMEPCLRRVIVRGKAKGEPLET
jgi:DNA (cytosine-5)-methyltransferase 1